MNWINVDKKLPKDGERVLVWNNKFREAQIQTYNEFYKCWDSDDGDDYDFDLDSIYMDDIKIVEYWMPLPEKPIGETNITNNEMPFDSLP
jgi:hypothetical protein